MNRRLFLTTAPLLALSGCAIFKRPAVCTPANGPCVNPNLERLRAIADAAQIPISLLTGSVPSGVVFVIGNWLQIVSKALLDVANAYQSGGTLTQISGYITALQNALEDLPVIPAPENIKAAIDLILVLAKRFVQELPTSELLTAAKAPAYPQDAAALDAIIDLIADGQKRLDSL